MAGIVTSCEIDRHTYGGTLNSSLQHTFKEKFKVITNVTSRDIAQIATDCRLTNPTEFPSLGGVWPVRPTYGLIAQTFEFSVIPNKVRQWDVDVSYGMLQPGQANTGGQVDNPLAWPATYSLEYIEYEEAITEARNVEPIGADSPTPRAALTLGAVVNGALQEFDEGIFDTARDAVLHIHKNVATLDEVISFNVNYARTTNSDNFFGAGPRRAKFLGADSGTMQMANTYTYYPMTIRVQIKKTTDMTVNNVGWNWWYKKDAQATPVLTKFQVKDEEGNLIDSPEPMFLQQGGGKAQSPTVLHYRYLTETSYTGLML